MKDGRRDVWDGEDEAGYLEVLEHGGDEEVEHDVGHEDDEGAEVGGGPRAVAVDLVHQPVPVLARHHADQREEGQREAAEVGVLRDEVARQRHLHNDTVEATRG